MSDDAFLGRVLRFVLSVHHFKRRSVRRSRRRSPREDVQQRENNAQQIKIRGRKSAAARNGIPETQKISQKYPRNG